MPRFQMLAGSGFLWEAPLPDCCSHVATFALGRDQCMHAVRTVLLVVVRGIGVTRLSETGPLSLGRSIKSHILTSGTETCSYMRMPGLHCTVPRGTVSDVAARLSSLHFARVLHPLSIQVIYLV